MDCWGICSTVAREKSSSKALSWPGHGDGEVAAGGDFGVAWQGEKRASARGRSGGEVQRDAWMPAQAGGGRGGGPEGGRRCPAAVTEEAEQAGRLEVEERTSLQFPKITGTQL